MFIVLLKVLKGVCCIAFVGHTPLVVYSGGLTTLDGSTLKLPGSPICATGHFVGVLEEGKVSIYYLRPRSLERVVRVSFVPSDCSSSGDLLALSQRLEHVAEVFNVTSKIAYVILNASFVEVFNNIIVIVRNKLVEVHARPSGFSVEFGAPVNDVQVKGEALYACTSRGLFLYKNGELRALFTKPCEKLFVGTDSTVLSHANAVYVLKGRKLLASLELPRPIRDVAIVNGKLYILSGDVLYEYAIARIDDKEILMMLGIPLVIAVTHIIIKLLRD